MKYLLFAEGFMLRGKFVFKEIAFYCLETNVLKQYIINSPSKVFNTLNKKERQTVNYCENHLHQIKWFTKGKSFHHVKYLINRELQSSDEIYTKGDQMKKFIELQINPRCRVIDFDSTVSNGVWFDKTLNESGQCQLCFHQDVYHCAVNKTYVCLSNMKQLHWDE
jgi:hypothetical protein